MDHEKPEEATGRIEPLINDCTQGNLTGLGIENVPSSYRALFVTFLIMVVVTGGFFLALQLGR